MRLHFICIGKATFPELEAGINRYLDRVRFYIPTEVHLLKAAKITPKGSEDAVKEREAERILKLLGKKDCLVLWDQRGKETDSVTFAKFLDGLRNRGVPELWMVVGGPLGVSQSVLTRADFVFSLSPMTFPHDLARLMVVEQIYRAFTILKGEPYHK
jgi:23S rRNA (pseudouridine1915-N3)-methyltransferase